MCKKSGKIESILEKEIEKEKGSQVRECGFLCA